MKLMTYLKYDNYEKIAVDDYVGVELESSQRIHGYISQISSSSILFHITAFDTPENNCWVYRHEIFQHYKPEQIIDELVNL